MKRTNRLLMRSIAMPYWLMGLLGIVGIWLMASSHARADAPLEGTKPAQWRVIWKQDPSTQATLCWSTAQAGTEHKVKFRQQGTDSFTTLEASDNGSYRPDELYWHRAELADLAPDTPYEVRMISDGEQSPLLYFVTAPDQDRPFTLLFGGDSRSSSKDRREVNRLMARLFSDSHDDGDSANDILALAHGGDYVASGGSLGQWSQWMSDHELTTTDTGRMLPIIPARGNHDRGTLFNQVFGFPEDDENQYVVSFGKQLTLVTLNTNESTAGDQEQWLKEQLKKSRPTTRWLLVQYHRPAYPAVKSPGSALRNWVPLFEEFDVDLACEADGHCIKRTLPIRDGKHDPTGVVYIGEGGLGVGQRSPKEDRWYLQSPGMASKGHHVQALTFSREELLYRCISLQGNVLDQYRLEPRKR